MRSLAFGVRSKQWN